MKWTKFPTIKKAALAIAYDNGMINRFEPEEKYLDACLSVIGAEGVYEEDIIALEEFLSGLSETDFNNVCYGDSVDMEAVEAQAPKNSDGHALTGILEDFFNVES